MDIALACACNKQVNLVQLLSDMMYIFHKMSGRRILLIAQLILVNIC